MKKFVTFIRLGIALLLSINLALISVKLAGSQTSVANVVVTSVNVNSFPEVQVQAKAVDANGGICSWHCCQPVFHP